MSEFDSSSGRKGFVRDVMRRISSPNPREDDPSGDSEQERGAARACHDEVADLHDTIRLFGADSPEFRRDAAHRRTPRRLFRPPPEFHLE